MRGGSQRLFSLALRRIRGHGTRCGSNGRSCHPADRAAPQRPPGRAGGGGNKARREKKVGKKRDHVTGGRTGSACRVRAVTWRRAAEVRVCECVFWSGPRRRKSRRRGWVRHALRPRPHPPPAPRRAEPPPLPLLRPPCPGSPASPAGRTDRQTPLRRRPLPPAPRPPPLPLTAAAARPGEGAVAGEGLRWRDGGSPGVREGGVCCSCFCRSPPPREPPPGPAGSLGLGASC